MMHSHAEKVVSSIASPTLLAFVAGFGVSFKGPKSDEVYKWHA